MGISVDSNLPQEKVYSSFVFVSISLLCQRSAEFLIRELIIKSINQLKGLPENAFTTIACLSTFPDSQAQKARMYERAVFSIRETQIPEKQGSWKKKQGKKLLLESVLLAKMKLEIFLRVLCSPYSVLIETLNNACLRKLLILKQLRSYCSSIKVKEHTISV